MASFPTGPIAEEHELIAVFGVVPDDARPHSGFSSFTKTMNPHLSLQFSFDLMQASVQTRITVNGRAVSTVAREGLDSIVVSECGRRVRVTFRNDNTVLCLQLGENVSVEWSTLI